MILPASDYRKTRVIRPEKLHQGLDAWMYGLLGAYRRKSAYRKQILLEARMISDQAELLTSLSLRELGSRLRDMKNRFRRQDKTLMDHVPQALALLVETASRTLGLRPFPVQVAGALALHRGYLTEMATGEGKSLTACLPAVLAGWTGRPCHIVTVNDYLASRDASEMKAFYQHCGVSVGAVTGDMDHRARQENYDKGVTYTTSKELTADFLRDRLALGKIPQASRRVIRSLLFPRQRVHDPMVMRGLYTAIVDEADSVLIDEAVTPLIISRPQENKPFVEVCDKARRLADRMVAGEDYTSDVKYKEIRLTSRGEDKLKTMAEELGGIWKARDRREELLIQSLSAREYYKKDKQYVVQDGRVVIVDEFTGRLMPNRTWRQGLHQAVEAREGLEITNPSETLARLSFQQFFRLFTHLSGMTGTGREASQEFWQIYGLPVITIPTHRPCVRETYPSRIFASSQDRWNAVVDEVLELHKQGRPILVGTRDVKASEQLADRLREKGLTFNLLNAIYHKEEAAIVRMAGQKSRITIATNMAGRGTDIKLEEGVAALGGLHVIATEGHESARIDRQLFGRSARQGDPGSSRAYMSLDDELMQRFIPDRIRRRMALALSYDRPYVRSFSHRLYKRAQKSAQAMAYKQRKSVLRMDTWLEEALSFTGENMLGA